VVDFRDSNGERRWETYRTRDEADTVLSKRVQQLTRGTYRAPESIPTFQEVAAAWLATKRDRRPSTYAQWQVHVDLHLVPFFGDMRISAIRMGNIDAFRQNRSAARLRPQTINKLLTTCAAVFDYAIRQEFIDRNPARVAERCRLNSGEVSFDDPAATAGTDERTVDPRHVLAPAEAAKVVEHAEPGLNKIFLLTAMLTGARVGELTALTWNDVSLAAKTIRIQRSLSWARERNSTGKPLPRFFEPKTKSSRRTIPIPDPLASALRRWKLECPLSTFDLVFPTIDGNPIHRSMLLTRALRPALAKAELPAVTIHSLRHTFASALILAGEPVTRVAHLLGHSSSAVTLSIYAHWFRQLDPKCAAVDALATTICSGGNA